MSTQATWPVFVSTLLDRREVAENTMAFEWEKPSGWSFKAGQFIDITLLDPAETDAKGNTRGFSIASAPFEDRLMFATRLRDTAFKRVLRRLPLKTQARIEGPFGDLRLQSNASRPMVFLSGGIGITPVRSIVLEATREKLPHHIVLFYSNRRPEDAPFLDDLWAAERANPKFKFVPTMTEMSRSQRAWNGETGLIDAAMLDRHLKSLGTRDWLITGPIYYLTGPPEMVKGMRQTLNNAGVDDDDIRTEEFAGY